MGPGMRNQLFVTLAVIVFLAVPIQSVFADQAKASDISKVDVRFLYVQPGQTLHNIVKRLYSHRKSEWPKITKDIVRMNPQAFVNNDATKMKAGVRLELPQRNKTKTVKKFSKKHVGDVLISRGQALAVAPDSGSRQLEVGDPVFVGDKLITGAEGFLRLHMIDNAVLDLNCYSIMVIEQYAISPSNKNNRSVLNLLEGSLKKVTGEIGKWKEDVYQLKTPVASIGVRGTEYALRVFQSKGCDGKIDLDDDGLYLRVAKGLIDVSNKSGTTTVAKGDTLYIPLPGAAPVDKEIGPGVLESADDVSHWWYLLGIALLAAAL